MNLWKFESISAFLHTGNRADKGFAKIEELWRLSVFGCKAFHYPSKNIVIDERMISFKGSSYLKKYDRSKPTRWGFKCFILSDEESYTYDMNLFPDLETEINFNKTESLILLMTADLNVGHILYTDAYYTSVKAASHLKE